MSDKNKNEYTNKCSIDSAAIKNCTVKMFTSPSNWAIAILTYMTWSLVGMRYSTNQNFNMVTAQQNYVMLLSLVSIIVAFVSYNTRLLKLALIGAITLPISFITVAVSQVGIIWLGIPIGYYVLCPISLFLFLLQIKQITCFAWRQYCEVLKSGSEVNNTMKDSSANLIKESTKLDRGNNKETNRKK